MDAVARRRGVRDTDASGWRAAMAWLRERWDALGTRQYAIDAPRYDGSDGAGSSLVAAAGRAGSSSGAE